MFERFKRSPPQYDQYTRAQYESSGISAQLRRDMLNENLDYTLSENLEIEQYDYYLDGLSGLELTGNESVLVVGSGDGYAEMLLRTALKHQGEIVALDIPSDDFTFESRFDVAESILAVQGLEGFEKVKGFAEALPFDKNSFDAVIVDHMLYHSPDIYRTLMEIRRVARHRAKVLARSNGVGNKMVAHMMLAGIGEQTGSKPPPPFSSRFDTDTLLEIMGRVFTLRKRLVERGFSPIDNSVRADLFSASIDTYAVSFTPEPSHGDWEEARRRVVDEPLAAAIGSGQPIIETIHRGGGIFTNDKHWSIVGDLIIRNSLRPENSTDKYLRRRARIVEAHKKATLDFRSLL